MELVWSTVHVGSIWLAQWETRAVSLRLGLCLHQRMPQSLREKISDNPVYVEHDCLDPMVQQCRRLLRESIEDRFHRQQGYAVKRVKVDRNKHERVKLAQQRCWVLDMAFFLYPPQVASSKCMLRVMFLPEMQGYSGRPTLCRTCSCCSTWSLHTRTTWNCGLLTKSRRGQ